MVHRTYLDANTYYNCNDDKKETENFYETLSL